MKHEKIPRNIINQISEPFHMNEEYLAWGTLISRLRIIAQQYKKSKAVMEIKSIVKNGCVHYSEQTISYEQLDKRSNKVANLIQMHRVPQGAVVSIAIQTKIDLCIAIWGVIKAGCVFYVTDLSCNRLPESELFPGGTSEYILSDSVQNHVADYQHCISYSDSDSCSEICNNMDIVNRILYIVRTSGSISQPKHICIYQHSVLNVVYWRIWFYKMGPWTQTLSLVGCQFDAFLADFFSTLLCGGGLTIIHKHDECNFACYARILSNRTLTNITATPSLYARTLKLVSLSLPHIQYLISGGEKLTKQLYRRMKEIFSQATIYNEYGPAECCMVTTCGIISDEDACNNIGRPIDNTEVYIDRHDDKSICGELYITGVGTNGRYLEDTLTRRAFLQHPNRPGQQIYKTGDIVEKKQGEIYFNRRLDDKVKILGYLVDKKEIEEALLERVDITDAKVAMEDMKNGSAILVAYVQCCDEWNETTIRAYLKERFPYYMIPSKIVCVSSLPLNEHGKKTVPRVKDNPSYNDIIRIVSQSWKTVLHQDDISPDQSFFEQGGNSLLFMDLFLLLNEAYCDIISVPELMEFYTIMDQTEFIFNKLNRKEIS